MTASLALLFALQLAPSGVSGVVRDELSGAPLAEAVVALPELGLRAVTGADGAFTFRELPPGPQHLTVARHGFAVRTLHALVPRRGVVALNVSLQPVPLELGGLTVEPGVAIRGVEPTASVGGASGAISRAAVRNHPMVAEPDVFEALEGGDVAVLPESHTGIHIRGGAASHTAFELDGIPVLGPLHAAGLFSAWNPDALSSIRVDPSAQGVLPSLSGTISGRTRTPGRAAGGSTVVSTTQARASVDGPIGAAGYLLSVRQGFPSSVVPPKDPAKIRGEVGDFLGKVTLPLLGGAGSVLAYGSENELSSGAVADLPSNAPPGPRNGFEWQTQAVGLTWARELSRGRVELRAWDSRATASADLFDAASNSAGVENRRVERGVLATVLRSYGPGELRLAAGLSRGDMRYSIRGAEPFLADGAHTVGSARVGYGRRLGGHVRIGGDLGLIGSSEGVYPSPRLEASAAIGGGVALTVVASRRHQLAQSLRNEESLLGTVFPADLFVSAAVNGVPVARADEISGRVEYRPTAGVSIGGQGYLRDLSSVLFVATRTGKLYSDGAFDVGDASVEGASLDVSLSGKRYGLVVDYAVQRVANRIPGGSFVPSYAPGHRAQAGVVLHATPTLALRLSHAAIWGRRATGLLGPVEWESCNLVDGGCELAGVGEHGSELGAVLPGAYHRTDLGARKHWHVGLGPREAMLTAYGTVTNLFGRSNVMNYYLDPSTGAPAPIDMLPLSPLVVGLELTF